MAKGKPTLFKKKGKPTQKQNIELAPRQKINSKSLEDIEKKSEDTGKKKEPRKRQRHPRGHRSLEMYHPVGVEEEKPRPSADLVRWATLLTAAAVATVSTASGKCIVVPSGSEGNRKQK